MKLFKNTKTKDLETVILYVGASIGRASGDVDMTSWLFENKEDALKSFSVPAAELNEIRGKACNKDRLLELLRTGEVQIEAFGPEDDENLYYRAVPECYGVTKAEYYDPEAGEAEVEVAFVTCAFYDPEEGNRTEFLGYSNEVPHNIE